MKLAGLFVLAALAVAAAPRPARFVLVLHDPPSKSGVPVRKDALRLAAQDFIRAQQSSLKQELAARKIRVTAADPLVANVVFVEAPADAMPQLAALPGVAYVERLRPLKRHLNLALNLMKIPAAWSVVNGQQNAGAGVKIAILDTGIDQNHPAFQSTTLNYPDGFPKGDAGWVNRKVIVARSYVNMLVGTDPATSRPDDLSPRDRVGHGTAVAMIAAGGQVTAPVTMIAGAAPGAWLGNYKIYGSPGVNGQFTYDDVVFQALNDALADGMDIAVLSLGAPAVWGPLDQGSTCNNESGRSCDWRAEAVETLAAKGLTIVASAGDSGDLSNRYPAYNSISTPGTAPAAITVGASTNAHIFYQTIRVTGTGVPADIQRVNAYFGDGPRPDPGVSAPVKDVNATGDNGRACSPLPEGSLNGVVALIERGDCEFSIKVSNAQAAGAVGAIIYQPQGVTGIFPLKGLRTTGIPAALVGNPAGAALKAYAARQADARVALDASFTAIPTTEYDTVAFFSSRGPSIRENAIKPELLAVGTDLYTATQTYDPNGELYDPSGYRAVQGTSFAVPLVAGAVAMVKQRNPSMTPAQLKSAVVNTADPRIVDYTESGAPIDAGVMDVGAGKLDAEFAVRTTVTVEPSTLSFGVIGDTLPAAKTLRLCNFGGSAATLQLAVGGVSSSAAPSLSTSRVTVNPNACNTDVSVRLTGSKPRPGIYEGEVQIQVSGLPIPLRVPYLYLVGDGVPFSIFPLEGNGFETATGATVPLTFKVVDQYGVPVSGQNVQFQTTVGGGSIKQEGKQTDELGIGFADVITGTDPGQQEYYAAVGTSGNFGIYFSGRARNVSTLLATDLIDAASYQANPNGFAPGSYLTIKGDNAHWLSDAVRVYNTPYLPLALAGVSVSFDVPSRNQSIPAHLSYVSPVQINLQIPYELEGATSALMKVSIGDWSSAVVTVPIASQSPSLFEYDGEPRAKATDAKGVLLGSSNPARKDNVIILYANGLGAVENQPASGQPASTEVLARTKLTPTVTIGNRPAEVQFSGLAPGFVGLYQLNVKVPADAPSGTQPVVITVNDVSSKPSNIPVE